MPKSYQEAYQISKRRSSPARDLVDDGAVVEIRFTRTHTGLQHIAMHVEHGESLPMVLGLLQHQVNVLERLSYTAFRHEVAIEHAIDHFGTLHIHDLRIGGGRLRHREESRRIEPKACGKYQPLGERHAIEAEDKIDGELGAPAVADMADMEAAREQDR